MLVVRIAYSLDSRGWELFYGCRFFSGFGNRNSVADKAEVLFSPRFWTKLKPLPISQLLPRDVGSRGPPCQPLPLLPAPPWGRGQQRTSIQPFPLAHSDPPWGHG